VQLVGIQIYNLDIARIKNQRNETIGAVPPWGGKVFGICLKKGLNN
jgi:hypothetical protein